MVAELRPEKPVYCIWPAILRDTVRYFVEGFPGTVMYAVKSNPEPIVVRGIFDAGIRDFDTASLAEIAAVKTQHPDANAYFMHPVKARGAIRDAYHHYNVRHFAIDHRNELEKLCDELTERDAVIVVRIATPAADVMFDLSGKFGADVESACGLLRMSAKRGFQTGLAFHVGSQCLNPSAFEAGFETAAQVLHEAGTELACFDIGGGFPVEYDGIDAPPLERYLDVIRDGLEALTLPRQCAVMCEPGRALVAGAQSLVVQVQLRKNDRLYINDGRYGSLIASSIGVAFPVRQVGTARHSHQQEFEVLGPTCDGLDIMPAPLRLPANIREGDWLEFGFAGAYSNALRTDFNGFRPDTFVTVDTPFGQLTLQ